MKTKMTGLDNILRNLNREVQKIENRSKAGLMEAALVVRGESQKITPVKTGHLKGSAGSYAFDTPRGLGAVIYYMAAYAVYVHEINATHRVGQWKFLETALKKNRRKVLEIIRKRARIRLGR